MSRLKNLCACGCGQLGRFKYAAGHNPERQGPYDWRSRCELLPNGCMIWKHGIDRNGYGVTIIHAQGKKCVRVHRLVFSQEKGPIPKGMFVCHTCDNPRCINPDHLWLGTPAENVRDMYLKDRSGTLNKPGRHPRFGPDEVAKIRRLPGPLTHIAKEFGVAFQTISKIRNRVTYRYVP